MLEQPFTFTVTGVVHAMGGWRFYALIDIDTSLAFTSGLFISTLAS